MKPGLHSIKNEENFRQASAAWDAGDLKRAFELFLRLARRGDSSGKINVGYFYDVGLHVPKDQAKALFWYRSACADGSSAAASNIATVHRDAKAFHKQVWWLRRAVAMGDGDALLDLARCYLGGKGVRKNRARAIELLEKVLSSDHVTDDSQEQARQELRRLSADFR